MIMTLNKRIIEVMVFFKSLIIGDNKNAIKLYTTSHSVKDSGQICDLTT